VLSEYDYEAKLDMYFRTQYLLYILDDLLKF
jgi:hypothetical protein